MLNKRKRLPLAAICLWLAIQAIPAAGQTLDSRSFDTPPVAPTIEPGTRLEAQTDSWVRVAPVGEEFTVLMPYRPTLKTPADGHDDKILSYAASSDGGIYMVTSALKKADDARYGAMLNPFAGAYAHPFFKEIREQGGQFKMLKQRNLTLTGYSGREYQLNLGDTPCVVRVYVTNRRVYTLIWMDIVIADLPGVAYPDRFMDSFTLGPVNKDAAASNVKTGDDRAPVTGIGLGTGCGGCGEERRGSNVRSFEPLNGDYTRVFSSREVTQRARLLSKPDPQYTEEARRNNINGTVVLKVVLRANGQVTDIQAVTGLPYGLTLKAIEAARQIRFVPAVLNGRAVSQSIQLEYNFNLY